MIDCARFFLTALDRFIWDIVLALVESVAQAAFGLPLKDQRGETIASEGERLPVKFMHSIIHTPNSFGMNIDFVRA